MKTKPKPALTQMDFAVPLARENIRLEISRDLHRRNYRRPHYRRAKASGATVRYIAGCARRIDWKTIFFSARVDIAIKAKRKLRWKKKSRTPSKRAIHPAGAC